jgi:hypothetical protein
MPYALCPMPYALCPIDEFGDEGLIAFFLGRF